MDMRGLSSFGTRKYTESTPCPVCLCGTIYIDFFCSKTAPPSMNCSRSNLPCVLGFGLMLGGSFKRSVQFP